MLAPVPAWSLSPVTNLINYWQSPTLQRGKVPEPHPTYLRFNIRHHFFQEGFLGCQIQIKYLFYDVQSPVLYLSQHTIDIYLSVSFCQTMGPMRTGTVNLFESPGPLTSAVCLVSIC